MWSVSLKEQLDFLQPLPSTWHGFCWRSAPPVTPSTPSHRGPRVRTVTRPALGDRLIPSIPPLFPDWTKTKGTIVRKRLPEQPQVSFSSGSELISLWLGNQRGKWGAVKAVSLWKHRDQIWAGIMYLSGLHCKVIWILTAACVSNHELGAQNHFTFKMKILIWTSYEGIFQLDLWNQHRDCKNNLSLLVVQLCVSVGTVRSKLSILTQILVLDFVVLKSGILMMFACISVSLGLS